MGKERYEIYWCAEGMYGECVRLVARGRQRITQNDIEEFMHNNLQGEYWIAIYKGYEEWYPNESADVVDLYNLANIADYYAKVLSQQG